MRTKAAAVLLPILLMLLSACTPPLDTQPFTEFSQSVRELRDGTDAVLKENATASRERILNGAEQGLNSDDPEEVLNTLNDLTIEFQEGDYFGWSNAKLPYMAAERFRSNVLEVNDLFVDYADLLVELAGTAPLSESSLDSMAASINSEAQRLAGQFDVEDASKASGIIATGATALFREFIRSKKRKHLQAALEHNQDTVASYAELMSEACEIAALDLRQSYLAKKDSYTDAIMDNIGKASLRARIEDLLNFNVAFTERMSALRDIYDNYKLAPPAHHDLIGTLDSNKNTIQSIRYLFEQGKLLRSRYRSLSGPAKDTVVEGGSE